MTLKSIVFIFVFLFTLTACGESVSEKQKRIDNIAISSCPIIKEIPETDNASLVREVNKARSEIEQTPYTDGAELIVDSIKTEQCEELIKNQSAYKTNIQKLIVEFEKDEVCKKIDNVFSRMDREDPEFIPTLIEFEYKIHAEQSTNFDFLKLKNDLVPMSQLGLCKDILNDPDLAFKKFQTLKKKIEGVGSKKYTKEIIRNDESVYIIYSNDDSKKRKIVDVYSSGNNLNKDIEGYLLGRHSPIELSARNGLLDGRKILRDSNNSIDYIESYKMGIEHGVYKDFHNGMLSIEANFVDGLLDGPYKDYDSYGNIVYEQNYKLGKKHGQSKKYSSNGELKSLTTYKNDVLDGVSKEWNSDGILIEESNFKNGKKHGQSKKYSSNGELKSLTTYKNDVLDGVSKEWNSDGILIEESNFKNGKKNGEYKKYDARGNLTVHINSYRNGKVEGTVEKWNSDYYEEIFYTDGRKNGYHRKTNRNSNIIEFEVFYVDGVKEGQAKYLMRDFDDINYRYVCFINNKTKFNLCPPTAEQINKKYFGGRRSLNSCYEPYIMVDPKYPTKAARDHKEGWVVLSYKIDDEDGSVSDVQVLESLLLGIFDREAKRAVRKWKFRKVNNDCSQNTEPFITTLSFTLDQN